jgi:rare lipoprotein A
MIEARRRFLHLIVMMLFSVGLSACAEIQLLSHGVKSYGGRGASGSQGDFKVGKPYSIQGTLYRPTESYSLDETGIASWYGPGFHSKKTANGERFDENELTAAHRTLQLPSLVRVTNLSNGKSVVVRVNDRGPFSKGRIIDVSKRAAELLEFKNNGTARVRVQVLAEESRQMAEAARRGVDTRGMEVAINNGQQPMLMQQGQPVTGGTDYGSYQTASAEAVIMPPPDIPPPGIGHPVENTGYSPSGIPGHAQDGGRFYPDPVVKQFPVSPTSLFVQAGSFSSHDNAIKASQRLDAVGKVRITPFMNAVGIQFYRVQVGPIGSVGAADALLSDVINSGFPEARITVDNTS